MSYRWLTGLCPGNFVESKNMSNKYKFTGNEVPHFIIMTLVEWIELFSKEKYKELIIENLKFCKKEKGLSVH
jgi:hypothetical protein